MVRNVLGVGRFGVFRNRVDDSRWRKRQERREVSRVAPGSGSRF